MIKAVTIDFWGTLLLDSPAADERSRQQRLSGLYSVLDAMGIPVSREALDRAYGESGRRLERRWRVMRDVSVNKTVEGILRTVDARLPESLGEGAMAELVRVYATPPLAVPPTFDPGAATALAELRRRGLSVGLVSNTMRTPGAVLRKILAARGLLDFFTALTFSDERGIRKPDPAIFALTRWQMGAGPGEAVHVGDDPVLDVAGAKAAGMRVIQMATDDMEPAEEQPDAVITRLSELPATLERLEALGSSADARPARAWRAGSWLGQTA